MKAAIIGIGTWLPSTVRGNDYWPSTFGQRETHGSDRTFNDIPVPLDAEAAAIVQRDLAREALDPMLGAKRRHVADEHQCSAEAEALAGRAALADAGVLPADIDLVLSHAMVPERLIPNAPRVAALLGAHNAVALGVDSVCASAVSQLEVARAYVESGLARHVLLTQSHLMLRTFPVLHPAAPGLGDGASALLVSRATRDRPGTQLSILSNFGQTHGEHAQSVTWVRGSDDDSDPAWWLAGGALRLGSRNSEGAKFLMRETVTFGAATVREAARRAGIDVERIAVLTSVQPRGFIAAAIAERLGLARDRAVTTYEDVAHVGACGPVFNLHAAKRLGLLVPGALVALYAQGAGFTRAAVMLEVQKTAST
jgi:3-oxoacyl-[acyl-carrier-protein] synthase-3